MKSTSNLKYLQCQKKGLHEGQFLNSVCLNSNCLKSSTFLCCCSCLDEQHQSHQYNNKYNYLFRTKSLKFILVEAEQLAEKLKNNGKVEAQINLEPLFQIIKNNQTISNKKFQRIKIEFQHSLNQMQKQINKYYTNLIIQIKEIENKQRTEVKWIQIQQKIDKINKCTNHELLHKHLFTLITLVRSQQNKKQDETVQFGSESDINLSNFIQNSNRELIENNESSLANLLEILNKNQLILSCNSEKMKNLSQKQDFKFTCSTKHEDIIMLSSDRIFSTKNEQYAYQEYKMAVMEPAIHHKSNDDLVSFRFYIKKLQGNWVGLGICNGKNAKERRYKYKHNIKSDNECYLICSNGKERAIVSDNLSQIKCSFSLKEGDSITCIVSKNSIHFIKNLPNNFTNNSIREEHVQINLQSSQSIEFNPCVVCYHEDTEIQYQLSVFQLYTKQHLPKYPYLFSNNLKHKGILLKNHQTLALCNTNHQYIYCLMDKPIQNDIAQNSNKTICYTYKIITCKGFIAVGICYKKIIDKLQFKFIQEKGMIKVAGTYSLSNQGDVYNWYEQDQGFVKGFQFEAGDFIQCVIRFLPDQNTITFKKGVDQCQLYFQIVPGDQLYPCVIMQSQKDQVAILTAQQ